MECDPENSSMNESSSSFNNNACGNALRHVGERRKHGTTLAAFFSPTWKDDISPIVEYGNETIFNFGLAIGALSNTNLRHLGQVQGRPLFL